MSEEINVSSEEIDALYERLDREAEASGYHLNPDEAFTRGLVEGLLINEKRYGYWACPCRLASGDKQKDLDIICPCDYRDPDLLDWGNCYCALYVSEEIVEGEAETQAIPERRPPEGERAQDKPSTVLAKRGAPLVDEATMPIWRCRVCGYLCARERPPGRCPICKAKQDRFEQFWWSTTGRRNESRQKQGGNQMSDRIYKKIEVIGTSDTSLEDAIQNAIEKSAKTVRNMRWFEVIETRGRVEDQTVAQWQVTVKVAFAVEG